MEQAHSRGNFHPGFDMSHLLQLLINQCFRVNGKQPKPPQFYSHSLELVTIVIVINAVIGRFSGEDLRAVCCKDQLRSCNIEKTDFPKLCQDKGLGELVLKI